MHRSHSHAHKPSGLTRQPLTECGESAATVSTWRFLLQTARRSVTKEHGSPKRSTRLAKLHQPAPPIAACTCASVLASLLGHAACRAGRQSCLSEHNSQHQRVEGTSFARLQSQPQKAPVPVLKLCCLSTICNLDSRLQPHQHLECCICPRRHQKEGTVTPQQHCCCASKPGVWH